MDFDEMRSAYLRATGKVSTTATGSHVPTFVADFFVASTAPTFANDLATRLMDHYEVTKDPLTREASIAIRYEHRQLQLNLAQLETAVEIMSALHAGIDELGEYSRSWPWEARGNGVDQKLNDALDACEKFMRQHSH